MLQRSLGPFTVGAIGLGCMNLSHGYGPPVARAQAEDLLYHALDEGITHFDTAALYGFGANESLVGPILAPHRQRIVLASKCGMTGVPDSSGTLRRVIDGRPATLRATCEASLQRLGTDVIDLYTLHRRDAQVPIEESVGALGDLVRAGKIRAVGVSEVSAATLRRAHAEYPVAAVQSEYSLWTRNPEIAVLAACQELGVSLVAFSPLGRGFLGGPLDIDAFDEGDIRRSMPRFAPAAYAHNAAQCLHPLQALARERGCSTAQLALAWLLQRGPHVLPIPGTTQVDHLLDNVRATQLELDAPMLARIGAAVDPAAVLGERYGVQGLSEVDTER